MTNTNKDGFRRVLRAIAEKNSKVRSKGYFAVVDKLDMPYTRSPEDDSTRGYPLVFTSMSQATSECAEIQRLGRYARVVNCVVECERYQKPEYELSI